MTGRQGSTQAEELKKKKKKRILKSEGRLKNHWNDTKGTNIQIIGITWGGEKEKGVENLFEKITAVNLGKLTDIQSRNHKEAQTRWTEGGLHQDT